MEYSNSIDLSQLENANELLRLNSKIDDLVMANLNLIKQLNDISFILPITKQTILLLYLGYKYDIPIVKGAALYQLYANDLLVIVMSLLSTKEDIEAISNGCETVYKRLSGDLSSYPTGQFKEFYDQIIHCMYEGKLYIPPRLW